MIDEVIKFFVVVVSSLVDINFIEIIELRFGGFVKWCFFKENGVMVKKVFKKDCYENYICKRKRN